jgi:hypothetical protein
MFSNHKLKRYSEMLGLTVAELEEFAKRYRTYLADKEITKNVLINGLFILEKIHTIKWLDEADKIRFKTKNLIIIKYSDEIVTLYKVGMGTARIVSHLKINHRVTISKSALDRFILANKIKRST